MRTFVVRQRPCDRFLPHWRNDLKKSAAISTFPKRMILLSHNGNPAVKETPEENSGWLHDQVVPNGLDLREFSSINSKTHIFLPRTSAILSPPFDLSVPVTS